MIRTWTPVLLIVLAVPLILGIVPRNRIYGVRTRGTLASDDVWYAANRIGGMVLLLAGLVWIALRTF